jgi:integral membrane protein (TIGR01906 family)
MPALLPRLAGGLATVLVPIVLVFLGIRLLLTDLFLQIEYCLPGFPADPYGFTLQDRLEYAGLSLRYLNTNAGISLLGDLTFPDGSPLFNARELSHMQDVKNILRPAMGVGLGLTLVLVLLLLLAWRFRWLPVLLRGIRRGGWVAVGLVATLAILGVFSFWQFFTVFHSLFFEGDSWLFLYSDTLIRLFPMRFWQDAFLIVGGFALLGGLALGLGLRRKAR